MKKRFLCFIIFVLLIINAFAKERYLNFRVTEDTLGYYYQGALRTISYKKDDIIKAGSSTSFLQTSSYAELHHDDPYEKYCFDYNKSEIPAIKTVLLVPEKTKSLLPDNILTYKKPNSKRVIFSNFLDFLALGKVEKFDELDIHYRANYITYNKFADEIKDDFFNDVITNVGLAFHTGDTIGFSNIEKINNNKYKCTGIAIQGNVIEAFDYLEYPYGWLGILETTPDDLYESFILTIDGDYIELDNETTGKHIVTLVTVDDSVIEELCNLLRTNKCDLSKVTWPRHADGSCDYDGSKKTVAVQTANLTSSTNVIKYKSKI